MLTNWKERKSIWIPSCKIVMKSPSRRTTARIIKRRKVRIRSKKMANRNWFLTLTDTCISIMLPAKAYYFLANIKGLNGLSRSCNFRRGKALVNWLFSIISLAQPLFGLLQIAFLLSLVEPSIKECCKRSKTSRLKRGFSSSSNCPFWTTGPKPRFKEWCTLLC